MLNEVKKMKAFIIKTLFNYFNGGFTYHYCYCIAESEEQAIDIAKHHVYKITLGKNGELIVLSCEEIKVININAKEIAEYIHTLDYMEYKTFLNSTYGCLSPVPTFKNFINFEILNLRHEMYSLALNMILEGDY